MKGDGRDRNISSNLLIILSGEKPHREPLSWIGLNRRRNQRLAETGLPFITVLGGLSIRILAARRGS